MSKLRTFAASKSSSNKKSKIGNSVSKFRLLSWFILKKVVTIELLLCIVFDIYILYYSLRLYQLISKKDIIENFSKKDKNWIFNLETSQDHEEKIDDLHQSSRSVSNVLICLLLVTVAKTLIIGSVINSFLMTLYYKIKKILRLGTRLKSLFFLIFCYMIGQALFLLIIFSGQYGNISVQQLLLLSSFACLGNINFLEKVFEVSKVYGILNMIIYIVFFGYLINSLFRIEYLYKYSEIAKKKEEGDPREYEPELVKVHPLNTIISTIKLEKKKLAIAPSKADFDLQIKQDSIIKLSKEKIEEKWVKLGQKYEFIYPKKIRIITKEIEVKKKTLLEYRQKLVHNGFVSFKNILIQTFLLLIYLYLIYNMVVNRSKKNIEASALSFRRTMNNKNFVPNSPGTLAEFLAQSVPPMAALLNRPFRADVDLNIRDYIVQPKRNLRFQDLFIDLENFEMIKNENENSAFPFLPKFQKNFFNKISDFKEGEAKSFYVEYLKAQSSNPNTQDTNNRPSFTVNTQLTTEIKIPNEVYEFIEGESKLFLNENLLPNAARLENALVKLIFQGFISANLRKLSLVFTSTNNDLTEIYIDKIFFKRGLADYFKPGVELVTITFFQIYTLYILGLSTFLTILYELVTKYNLLSTFKANLSIYNTWYDEDVKNKLSKKQLAQRSKIEYEFLRKMRFCGYFQIVSSLLSLFLTSMFIYTTIRFYISYGRAKDVLEQRRSGPIKNDISVLIMIEDLNSAQNLNGIYLIIYALLRVFSIVNWFTGKAGRIFRSMISLTIQSFFKVGISLIFFSILLGLLINIYTFNRDFNFKKLYDVEIYLFKLVALFSRRKIKNGEGVEIASIISNIIIIPIKYLLLSLILYNFKKSLKRLLKDYFASQKQSTFESRRPIGIFKRIKRFLNLIKEKKDHGRALNRLKRLNSHPFNNLIKQYLENFIFVQQRNIESGLQNHIWLLKDIKKEYNKKNKILEQYLLGLHMLKENSHFNCSINLKKAQNLEKEKILKYQPPKNEPVLKLLTIKQATPQIKEKIPSFLDINQNKLEISQGDSMEENSHTYRLSTTLKVKDLNHLLSEKDKEEANAINDKIKIFEEKGNIILKLGKTKTHLKLEDDFNEEKLNESKNKMDQKPKKMIIKDTDLVKPSANHPTKLDYKRVDKKLQKRNLGLTKSETKELKKLKSYRKKDETKKIYHLYDYSKKEETKILFKLLQNFSINFVKNLVISKRSLKKLKTIANLKKGESTGCEVHKVFNPKSDLGQQAPFNFMKEKERIMLIKRKILKELQEFIKKSTEKDKKSKTVVPWIE